MAALDKFIWRFTPTRVRTTKSLHTGLALWPVHPHARGDDYGLGDSCQEGNGSPPRAWGRRPQSPDQACSPPVHPHARGDDCILCDDPMTANGSPPRSWGRLLLRLFAAFAVRFTPTRVGTTEAYTSKESGLPVHPHVRGDDAAQS